MVADERRLLRKKLDMEMRFYRLAGREKEPTNGLLTAVRQALKVPLKEIAGLMEIGESNVFELEERERTGSITLRSLGRIADAMGCKVVYGVIPLNGKTLEDLAEERLWRDVFGGYRDQGAEGPRDQGGREGSITKLGPGVGDGGDWCGEREGKAGGQRS